MSRDNCSSSSRRRSSSSSRRRRNRNQQQEEQEEEEEQQQEEEQEEEEEEEEEEEPTLKRSRAASWSLRAWTCFHQSSNRRELLLKVLELIDRALRRVHRRTADKAVFSREGCLQSGEPERQGSGA